ncbi:MAG: DNA starvation/stationary phase protection protein [Bacteroidetes bacterium 24-39-8]|jgi:starvation-inducible DNA-binding protein|nr:MAG: DNA starvation/stationary phase protection protein [Sphingobacteriia bacterium 35-40-5]OYZ48758.1 MAG: DNA starvation/stationary phase protection protein [Bacteroidetes bacterium 24-39-8]OZA68981.1 MAG: DNA starvation/stationary phase protection protein [Sphingobacteriia bacterium 39-39-8]HQR94107.1 DNA starvation/stationary phase protection protein [Sediminibacterium sp.]HQS56156.1 DNA starvation/stationary phase protection protein [Sediminibacterium sp.]
MKTNIGISDKHLVKSSSLLSEILSDEMILYVKTRKFHWNVSGESFLELHKLFESQYKQMELSIDLVAERMGKLGQKTPGTMEEFLQLGSLKESPGKYATSKDMLKELLLDHESLVLVLRKSVAQIAGKINDAGTADFLTGLMEEHESIAWVLRRYQE